MKSLKIAVVSLFILVLFAGATSVFGQSARLVEAEIPFDFVVNAVSIQYLTRPIEVFQSVSRVLRPGGHHLVAVSHRCFPTKAIRAFHLLPPPDRIEVVRSYFRGAGG